MLRYAYQLDGTRYDGDSPLGRLTNVRVIERNDVALAVPEVTEYAYDLVGNLDEVIQSNGVAADYQYDALNRLELLVHFKDANGNGTWDDNVNGVVEDPEVLAAYEYQLGLDAAREMVTEYAAGGAVDRVVGDLKVSDTINRSSTGGRGCGSEQLHFAAGARPTAQLSTWYA